MKNPRAALARARRIVVKVGSSSLADGGARAFSRIAAGVSCAIGDGRSVILVSSGAIALGLPALGCRERPKTIPLLQAAAAAGQPALMQKWERAFRRRGHAVAQILLTHADLAERRRYLNARRALDALLERGLVPIINENDTVADEEIRFGDNDQLAAMVTSLVRADLLLLLTDVDGLRDTSDERVPIVDDVKEAQRLVRTGRPRTLALGSGGMTSKLEAARLASLHGVHVVVASARSQEPIEAALAGEDIGTFIPAVKDPVSSRKHWIAFTLRPRGSLFIDDGARAALAAGRSLLPSGITNVSGRFEAGDAVVVKAADGAEVARGLCAYSANEVGRICGRQSREILPILGYELSPEVIHRDDLVLTTSS